MESMAKAYDRFTVKEVESKSEWDKFLEVAEGATFFHSLEWRGFLAKMLDCRQFYLTVRNEVGELCGVFPSFVIGSNRFKACVSLPLSDYGGPLTASREAGYALYWRLMEACADMRISFVRLCLLEPFHIQLFRSNLGCADRGKGVVEIDLSRTDSSFVWNHVFSSVVRRKINRLKKLGLEAYELTSKCDLSEFYRIYAADMKHIGVVPQTFSYLKTMWEMLYPKNLRIWLTGANKPFGGLLVLKDHKVSYTYFLGIDRTKSLSHPVFQYLVWSEILKAESEGLGKVSLGSTPADQGDTHHRIKRDTGGIFRLQEIAWIPTDSKGRLFLQIRGKVATLWRRSREYLPKETKSMIRALSKYTFNS